MIKLSADQDKVLSILLRWFKAESRPQFITLGGFAGTGKTTLISVFRRELNSLELPGQSKGAASKLKVAFCSYTGKAARVLKQKLMDLNVIYKNDTVGTIHSLIYSPVLNSKEEIVGWERKDKLKYDLIIVDEASMVDESIWRDLCSYKIPILAVGDHGQLPPISGRFNLMEKPMLKLEEIHRQAKDNPIINLSIQARERGSVKNFNSDRLEDDHRVKIIDRGDPYGQETVGELLANYNDSTLILCGYNTTRIKLNNHIRGSLGIEGSSPQSGDRVICLRNNHKKKIFNGMQGVIHKINEESDDWYYAEIEMDGEEDMFKGLINKAQFNASGSMSFGQDRAKSLAGDLFDFGYALTVHKAQGSQAKRVLLFEERFKQMDDEMWRRWLYTAVTRAEEELYIVTSGNKV